jgi:hypothetical protein
MRKLLASLMVIAALTGQALADGADTGTFKLAIPGAAALADEGAILKRMLSPAVYQAHFGDSNQAGQAIDPTKELWVLHVPGGYDGSTAYGLLVWIPPGDDARIPAGWTGILESRHIIYIAAEQSGNSQSVYARREPLALTGYAYVLGHYRIDSDRVYVGGFSGGGVVASHIAPAYADIFAGGLFVSTSDGIDIAPSNGVADDRVPPPAYDGLALMRSRGRYIFTVGADDSINALITQRAFASYRTLCIPRIKLLQIAKAAHENLSARWLEYSLNYLDSAKPSGDPQACTGAGRD